MTRKLLDRLEAHTQELQAQKDYPKYFFSSVRFGRDCKATRKARRQTLEQVLGYTRVSIATLSRVENHAGVVDTSRFLILCEFYGLEPMDYLSEEHQNESR